MTKNFTDMVQEISATTLSGPAHTPAELRHSAAQIGQMPEVQQGQLPLELQNYLRKVAAHSYKVMDRDIDQLLASGYTQDEIYELTVAAAFGAGLARLEHGLALFDNALVNEAGA